MRRDGKPGDPPPIPMGGGGLLAAPFMALALAIIIVGLVLAFGE